MVGLEDKFPLCSGEVLIEGKDQHGNVVLRKHIKNLIVNRARELMADYFGQDFTDPISEIAVGDGGGTPPVPPTVSDTTLASEIIGGRKSIGSITRPTTYRTEFQTTFGTGEANGSINEAGLFAGGGSPATVMVARVTFDTITKTSALTLTVTWKITF